MSKRPRKLFPGQRDDEHVIFLLRPHWLIFLGYVLRLLGLNLLPLIIFIFMYYGLGWDIPTTGPLYAIGVLFVSLYYIGAWLGYYHAFVDYHLDLWILTDQRIIDIEQKGLFDRVIAELNIMKVQDVTAEVHGNIQTFFDYGNVYIQTAAEQQRFIFQNVPHPEEIARLILRANDTAAKRQAQYGSAANTDTA